MLLRKLHSILVWMILQNFALQSTSRIYSNQMSDIFYYETLTFLCQNCKVR
uniref:Uncharacterized protein n=1 Tax=Triticum urartu TaxID=4572 RepID=A0A8R7U054_TRIUA